ncbi:hypothetical protein [Nocardia sp. CC227C]|uniref:hypothetical protein n=1 Tax=Nocardia sp. CC227C TaxID=3044562 RepID=UPI00278C0C8A|nr:hypothetical protein [Nocardia sp. CC227C]
MEPGALPPKEKLNPVKGSDGLYHLDRVRHRAQSGQYVRTSATGRTRRECLEEWHRNFAVNVLKGSKRRQTTRRRQWSPTDKMSDVFAELDTRWEARVDAGTLSADTWNNYHRVIYKPDKNPARSPNPDALKLEAEMGGLTIREAASVGYIADYIDEATEIASSTAYMQHRVLSMAFKIIVQGQGLPPGDNPMPYVERPAIGQAPPRPLDIDARVGVLRRIDEWLEDGRGESRYLRFLYLLLLGTGMRPGEGLAIRPCDAVYLDLDGSVRRVLKVSATVSARPGVAPYRKEGRKSGNPYQVVLPDWLSTVWDAEVDRVRPKTDDSPLIQGPRSDDAWISPATAREAVQAMRAGSDYDDFRLSDLRDTVATHVALVTGSDDCASAQLGHADGNRSMAQRHYIHKGIRRQVVVDNCEVLELLNPFKVTLE